MPTFSALIEGAVSDPATAGITAAAAPSSAASTNSERLRHLIPAYRLSLEPALRAGERPDPRHRNASPTRVACGTPSRTPTPPRAKTFPRGWPAGFVPAGAVALQSHLGRSRRGGRRRARLHAQTRAAVPDQARRPPVQGGVGAVRLARGRRGPGAGDVRARAREAAHVARRR